MNFLTNIFARENHIFFIEEPELHLHPSAQRLLIEILNDYNENNQFFIISHSPYFINYKDIETTIMVKMQDNRSRISQIPLNHFDQETKAKIGKEFNSDKREIFFSSAVLLVEGSTEKGTYPLIAQKLDHNFNEANIFVCDVGGVTSFKLYIAILNSFNIPFVCVCDEDHEQYVKNLAGDNRMLVNRPDFEGVLKRNGFEHLFVEARNIVGNKKPRVARYVITKIIEENQEIPKEFENVINKIYDVSQIKK